jgi:hypothetical protein
MEAFARQVTNKSKFDNSRHVTKSTQHLFLLCSTFGSLWPLVRSWIDISSVDSQNLSDHFLQFTYICSMRPSSAALIFGTHLVIMCLDFVELKKLYFSEIQRCPYLNCWTRSNSIHIGGLSQQIIILLQTIIGGGWTLLLIWILINYSYCYFDLTFCILL